MGFHMGMECSKAKQENLWVSFGKDSLMGDVLKGQKMGYSWVN